MRDYVNCAERHEERRAARRGKPERTFFTPLFLCVGLLCVTQAILNISLRVTYNSSTTSTCNSTGAGGRATAATVAPKASMNCREMKNRECNKLQERVNALTADKSLLENRNNILLNNIKKLEEDLQRLQMNLTELRWASCPPGWTEIDSRCYFLSTEMKTWEGSRRDCQSRSGDLVVMDSEREQVLCRGFTGSAGTCLGSCLLSERPQRALYRLGGDADLLFWIGLHGTSGSFVWVDGSPLTSGFWQEGQPDHGGPNNVEDCVEMYHHNPVLASWNDAPCGSRRRWMCETRLRGGRIEH